MYSKNPKLTEKRGRFETREQRKSRKSMRMKALQLSAFIK